MKTGAAPISTPPIGDPTLCQMVRPVMQHMAALTERAQIVQSIVGRIAVHVCRRKHDAGHPKSSGLNQVGPSSHSSAPVPPRPRLVVIPTPVREAADAGEVWSTATLALSFSTLEPYAAAQLAPELSQPERALMR